MNNIFESDKISVLNYVKEHIKEIHTYSVDFPDKLLWRAYLLLDDDSIIGVYDLEGAKLHFCFHLISKSGKCLYKDLEFSYPELSIRDLSDNIIDYDLVERDTVISISETWRLLAG